MDSSISGNIEIDSLKDAVKNVLKNSKIKASVDPDKGYDVSVDVNYEKISGKLKIEKSNDKSPIIFFQLGDSD